MKSSVLLMAGLESVGGIEDAPSTWESLVSLASVGEPETLTE